MQRYRIGILVGLWSGVAACGLIADLGPPPDVVAPSDGSADVTGESSVSPDVVPHGDGSLDAQDGSVDAQDGSVDAQDAADGDSEASTDGDAGFEAAPPPPVPPDASCNADAPFGDPAALVLDAGGGPENFDARLTLDELTVYFASDSVQGTPAALRIWSATRAHFFDSFGPPAPVDGINPGSVVAQYAPSVTEDGLSLFLNEYNANGNESEIFLSTRSGPSFGPANVVGSLDGNYANPMITPDGTALYFWAPATASTGAIYFSTRSADGGFGPPTAIEPINSGGDAENLAVSADQRIIIFSSNRGPRGDADIWISTRPTVTDPWGSPISLPGNVNSSASDSPTWISGDGCRLYFQSNRTTGRVALYSATRPQ